MQTLLYFYKLLIANLKCVSNNVFNGEAVLFKQELSRSGSAEGIHGYDSAVKACILMPGVSGACLYANACAYCRGDNAFLILSALCFKELHTGHGNDSRVDAVCLKLSLCLNDKLNLTTGSDEYAVGGSLFTIGKDVAALESVYAGCFVLCQRLTGKNETGGGLSGKSGDPSGGSFLIVAGTEYLHVGDGAEADEVLNGLVGAAVLTNADGVVRQDVDSGDIHEGGESHCVLHIIGEYEEGCAVATEAAVYYHTVGDSSHSVLTDTEVDVGAGHVVSREVLSALHVGFVGGSEVCTAADKVGNECSKLVENGEAGAAGCICLGDSRLMRSPMYQYIIVSS